MATEPTHLSTVEEFYTEERCYITEWVNSGDQPEASLAQCRVAAGVETQLHRLSVTEWYIVRSGNGELRINGGEPLTIGTGDRVRIPAGASQQVLASGPSDLIFDCLCIPRFFPECYESLE